VKDEIRNHGFDPHPQLLFDADED